MTTILALPVAIDQRDAILIPDAINRPEKFVLKQHADQLRQALTDSHALAERIDEPGFPGAQLELLQDWQRRRLARSYHDLISQPRYRAAGDFFLDELYGGLNFRERDQQMERVLPVMVRTLRKDMLLALAGAFELQALSLSLDMDMATALLHRGWDQLNTDRYGEIYRVCGRPADRERQIELIGHLGMELNQLVHHRLVMILIRTLRGPARAAGFGLLQTFLEQGLRAFQIMGDGSEFIETIWRSEERIMQRLFAGDEHPF
ncbi:MAG: hypothetical protein WBS20_18565 [Lysobacterales bacterium]